MRAGYHVRMHRNSHISNDRATWASRRFQVGRSWFSRRIVGPGAGGSSSLRIGHRGAGTLEPENTLRSIEAALRHGVEMAELDVRPCADGTLVLMHDDDLPTMRALIDAGVDGITSNRPDLPAQL